MSSRSNRRLPHVAGGQAADHVIEFDEFAARADRLAVGDARAVRQQYLAVRRGADQFVVVAVDSGAEGVPVSRITGASLYLVVAA